MRSYLCAFIALAALPCSACGPGAAARALRPDAPTGAEALGGGAASPECRAVAAYAEPLVVDWGSADRADLELGMRGGVVVVAYDCAHFRVLKSCRATGSYAFASVSRKEDSIQLLDSDEVRANMPLGAATLGAKLTRGSALDLALVLVGKQATTLASASRDELAGSCEGATHFVRAATIGAFAMSTGTVGKVTAVAELFRMGAGTDSSSTLEKTTRDGDLEACRRAAADSTEPPEHCRTAIRLELEPIRTAPPRDDTSVVRAVASPCPDGMVWSGGRCAAAATPAAHLCAGDDLAGCEEQCNRGSGGSCQNAAVLHQLGRGTKADETRSADYLEKACALGHAPACGSLGDRLLTGFGRPKDPKRGEQLEARACEMGEAGWCSALGRLHAAGRDGIAKDPRRAVEELLRGCRLGAGGACGELGDALVAGEWTPKDLPRAVGLYKRACDAGGTFGATYCRTLGDMHREGSGTPRDVAAALAAYQRACGLPSKLDDAGQSCVLAAGVYQRGEGVPRDAKRARELLERACAATEPDGRPHPNAEGCMSVGAAFELGAGVAADLSRAATAYDLACKADVKTCRKYGEMREHGRGVARDARAAAEAYLAACAAKDEAACAAQRRLAR